jgi:hypothetical protein
MTDVQTISHAEHGSRGAFFIEVQGRRVAELTYGRRSASLVNIDHTEVDASLRGQGTARKLLDAAVQWARETHTQFTATCSYAAHQLARDASLKDVLAPDTGAPSVPESCLVRPPRNRP